MEPSRMKRIDQVYVKWQQKGARRDRFESSSCSSSNNNNNTYISRRHAPRPATTRPAKYRRRIQHKEQRANDNASRLLTGFVPSLGIDLSEAQTSGSQKMLSLSRCCGQCLPSSRTKFVSKEFASAGLHDVLRLNSVMTTRPTVWSRLLPRHVYHALNVGFNYPLPDIREATLSSERVQRAIESSAQQLTEMDHHHQDVAENNNEAPVLIREDLLDQERRRAVSVVANASGKVHKWLLRLTVYVFHKVMGRLFQHMHVQRSHIEMLLAAQQQGVSLVFLPCHKSHLDYLLLTFILAHYKIKIPHIAAGENLNITLFSYLIRHLGGFFIRRKLHGNGGTRATLYWECLHEHFEQLLKNNQNIEVFIEGSRSRTGKPTQPKAGLLSFLVSAVKEGVVPDILLVPVSICYDRNVERSFIREELMGRPKTPENFWQALKGTYTMLTQNVGTVRVDFGQPFSIQEYLSTAVISQSSLMSMTLSSHIDRQSPLVSPSISAFSSADSSTRRQITALSYHIVYEFTKCASLMATSMVSFLLLTKHRHGVQLPELVTDYEWLSQKGLACGRALGFPGSSSEAVHYALTKLDALVQRDNHADTTKKDSCTMIYPSRDLPSALELLYHANQVSPMFIREAIIACSLEALCEDYWGDEEEEEEEEEWEAKVGVSKDILVSQDELMEEALLLCRIFSKEFVFAPPCVDVSTELLEGIEVLSAAEVLKKQQSSYVPYGHGVSVRYSKMSWYDDDEDDETELSTAVSLKVSSTTEAARYLSFLRSVLAPYVEGYQAVAVELSKMEGPLPDESTLLSQLHENQMSKAEKGHLVLVESCSADIIRNALRSYINMEVLVPKEQDTLVIDYQPKLLKIIDILTKINANLG